MKLSDFTMEQINIAMEGQPERLGEWATGSRNNMIGRGTIGGTRYQIKLHGGEPKWYCSDEAIRDKQQEINACDPDDFEKMQRLQSELDTLKRLKAKRDSEDEIADGYLECKQRLVRAVNTPADPQLVGSADFWKEKIPFKGNGVFALEATPWIEGSVVGFTPDSPIMFGRDLTEDQRYDVVASLAGALDKLHSRGVIHCDLKLGNTMVLQSGGKFTAILIDYDSAILLSDLHSHRYPFGVWYYIVGGTYFSPETYQFVQIVREEPDEGAYNEFDLESITTKSDIFALAVTIYEYFYGRVDMSELMPFRSPSGEALDVGMYALAVAQGYKPDFPDTMSDLLYGALNWMLDVDPKKRPTAAQVQELFATRDLGKIPGEYLRNPLWPAHQEGYKLVPVDGVSVSKATTPNYRVRSGGLQFIRTIDQLVSMGYAVRIGGEEPVEEKPKGKLWDRDGGGALPACVTRSIVEGKYMATLQGIRKAVDYAYLKAEGFFCDEAEAAKPWPCDSDLRYSTEKPVMRDFDRGPGNYIVGSGISSSRCNREQLLLGGYASAGITFSLWAADAEKYAVCSEGVPSTVKSIVRDSLRGKGYRVSYQDGRLEKLLADEMLARGFIKTK